MRTIIQITEQQAAFLQEMCEKEGVSRAEAIRRALDAYINTTSSGKSEAFGVWKNRGIDSVVYQQKLRDEW